MKFYFKIAANMANAKSFTPIIAFGLPMLRAHNNFLIHEFKGLGESSIAGGTRCKILRFQNVRCACVSGNLVHSLLHVFLGIPGGKHNVHPQALTASTLDMNRTSQGFYSVSMVDAFLASCKVLALNPLCH
jgi:hypothetical protein